jgi:hypothetical protein
LITTPELIELLSASATPVRRLRPPLLRAAIWLAAAAAVLALLAVSQGVRADLGPRFSEASFAIGIASALATGVLAAVAAFMVGQPDRSSAWLLLPMPPLAVWLSTITYGCLTDWVSVGPEGLQLGETVRCFATVLLSSLPLSLLMVVMLRHGALLRPAAVGFTAGMAVAAMAACALSILHELNATVMVLIGNLGTAAVLVGLAVAWALRVRRAAPGG